MKISKELGLMLYWGEGDKARKSFVALTNTDPKVLIYFINWFRRYFNIDESRLRGRLYIWEDLDEEKAKRFWSQILHIPISQFTKSYISQSKSKVRKRRHVYGVCRISYCSAEIFREIMKGIGNSFH